MAKTNFLTHMVVLSGLKPDIAGVIRKDCMERFETNVISCGASIQSWKVAYETGHWVLVSGAGIDSVEPKGVAVTFSVWLQLSDGHTAYGIVADQSELVVQVSAYCE